MSLIIAIIIIISVFAFCFGLLLRHCPRRRISEDTRRAIKEYGLVHFSSSTCVEPIMLNGVVPDNSKKLSWLEKDMSWTYINYPGSFSTNLADVRSKHGRKDYDAAVFIKGLTDDQIDHMRQKLKTNVIVHIGKTLKTDRMTAQTISK